MLAALMQSCVLRHSASFDLERTLSD